MVHILFGAALGVFLALAVIIIGNLIVMPARSAKSNRVQQTEADDENAPWSLDADWWKRAA